LRGQFGRVLSLGFKSASPGLILAVLGAVLMVTTIVTHHQIQVDQKATYLFDMPSGAGRTTTGSPPPLHLPEKAVDR
jgi:hypothetical protein